MRYRYDKLPTQRNRSDRYDLIVIFIYKTKTKSETHTADESCNPGGAYRS